MILADIEPAVSAITLIVGGEILLVGAFARDLCLDVVVAPPRATNDVDLVVVLPNWPAVDELFRRCEAQFETRVADLRLRHRATGIPVDILPCGPIENPPGRLALRGSTRVFDNTGLRDALRLGQPRTIGATKILVPPAPAMILLKLVAWKDRRAAKDVQDVGHILKHVRADEAMWDDPLLMDRFADGRMSYDDVVAWQTGRFIRREFDEDSIAALRRATAALTTAEEWLRIEVAAPRPGVDRDARIAAAERAVRVLDEAVRVE